MKIKAFHKRDDLAKGEWPNLLIDESAAEAWWGREPFEELRVEGVSASLLMAAEGTLNGHNVATDSMFTDSMFVDQEVPVSPLFVKDLCGRIVYIGFGPERKGNAEWANYQPKAGPDGVIPEETINAFVPMVAFPRFCRDVEQMEGEELLEHVFLTKFRCLEMSRGYNGQLSGVPDEEPLVAATYFGANLYPYKLRLDTFYTDGFKLPQTQMVYARGENEGIRPQAALNVAELMMANWRGRVGDADYIRWLEALGEAEVDRLYEAGCTLIPTVEACNGFHVVGRAFELEDYWPGRAVLGLHNVVEERADQAPAGTILEVLEPGYVTATVVKPARVIVSDGSGYVSPNNEDPLPLVPNVNLPHPRTLDNWFATWLPTHPEHFEAPAIWGWDMLTGRFMQLGGPIWDPLHYYYESVDLVLKAFDKTPLENRKGLVPVPEAMLGRFFPIVPMRGFDTFSESEYQRRIEGNLLPQSCIKWVMTAEYTAGLGYHPMPAEYEFELDTFWFPELHPLNRMQGLVPEELAERIAPVIDPKVTVSMFTPTVDAPEEATWFADAERMMTPMEDPIVNYPQLMRYLMDDLEPLEVVRLCPVPFLSEPLINLNYPTSAWWMDGEGGEMLDGPLALQELVTNAHDALWDMRQKGVQLVKFRHMVYRTALPLYMMGWWYGWSVKQLEEAMEAWIVDADTSLVERAEMFEEAVDMR